MQGIVAGSIFYVNTVARQNIAGNQWRGELGGGVEVPNKSSLAGCWFMKLRLLTNVSLILYGCFIISVLRLIDDASGHRQDRSLFLINSLLLSEIKGYGKINLIVDRRMHVNLYFSLACTEYFGWLGLCSHRCTCISVLDPVWLWPSSHDLVYFSQNRTMPSQCRSDVVVLEVHPLGLLASRFWSCT